MTPRNAAIIQSRRTDLFPLVLHVLNNREQSRVSRVLQVDSEGGKSSPCFHYVTLDGLEYDSKLGPHSDAEK